MTLVSDQLIEVDFNNLDASGRVVSSLRFANVWERPEVGDWVRLSDAEGNLCVGQVEELRNLIVAVRPEWDTWLSVQTRSHDSGSPFGVISEAHATRRSAHPLLRSTGVAGSVSSTRTICPSTSTRSSRGTPFAVNTPLAPTRYGFPSNSITTPSRSRASVTRRSAAATAAFMARAAIAAPFGSLTLQRPRPVRSTSAPRAAAAATSSGIGSSLDLRRTGRRRALTASAGVRDRACSARSAITVCMSAGSASSRAHWPASATARSGSPREHEIMYRRWRQELANHDWEYGADYPRCYLAPPGDAAGVDCHCASGIGTMRKQRPYGCSRPRCGICHWGKFWEPKRRAAERRSAIQYELAA